MDETDWLTERFEEHRAHLRAVAYRMLGSLSEADDAVQETWLRLNRADTSDVENRVAGSRRSSRRVRLNRLRSRSSRREEPLNVYVPDPIVRREDDSTPSARLSWSTPSASPCWWSSRRSPAGAPGVRPSRHVRRAFEEIASTSGGPRRAPAARQPGAPGSGRGHTRRGPGAPREAVDAFFAAARGGDFDALVAVLDPDVVLRSDGGVARLSVSLVVRGAETVASRALMFTQLSLFVRPAIVNGVAGVVVAPGGRPVS